MMLVLQKRERFNLPTKNRNLLKVLGVNFPRGEHTSKVDTLISYFIKRGYQMFKIRRLSDGMFSCGGSYPRFNKNGKVWRLKAHVKLHLAGIPNYIKTDRYKDCEVIEFELVQKNVVNLKDFK